MRHHCFGTHAEWTHCAPLLAHDARRRLRFALVSGTLAPLTGRHSGLDAGDVLPATAPRCFAARQALRGTAHFPFSVVEELLFMT